VRSALLDTGPVVGLLSARDEHHDATVAAIRASAHKGRSLCTIWEVIGEAYTLIRVRVAPAGSAESALLVLRWARESGVDILPATEADHDRAAAILGQYRDRRLSYVDALLLAIAERHRVEELVTVDARHFGAVRLAHPLTLTVV
jgi:predicted nucleic acid-binding protein